MFVASKLLFKMTKQKTIGTINTCDGFGTLKIQNIYIFMVLVFVTNNLPS